MQDAESSKLRLRFWLQMLKATKHVENEIRDRLRREFDVTLPQFDVMAILHKSESGLKMSALSQQLMVSNGNVTGIVDRLAMDNLVERVAIKGDRRAILVRLTLVGTKKFHAMASVHEGWVAELLADVTDSELDVAMSTLALVRDE